MDDMAKNEAALAPSGRPLQHRELEAAYDVVVIGGGAAGLSGALALGRARRTVLVVDAGEPRNATAGHVHNYLASEGVTPSALLATGRAEVAEYGVHVAAATVTAVQQLTGDWTETLDGTEGDRFRVDLADGRSVRSRRLLVATGLVDELPEVPGVAERWGRDVIHCPYCHGWEVRDRAIGILGNGPMAVHQALLFRQWSADVVLFRHTAPTLSEEQSEQLTARGIAVVDGEVSGLDVDEDRLAAVRLRSGEVVPRRVVVVGPRFVARAEVLATLGLETTELEMAGHVVGRHVPANAAGATSVPGVWVAGNVTDLPGQVITAAAAGLLSGAAINGDLIAEETARAVAAFRASELASVQTPAAMGGGRGEGGPRRTGRGTENRSATMIAETDGEDGGGEAERFWEGHYRGRERVFGGSANAILVDVVGGLPAGTALDLGCGEGGDAIWLAGRGWRVTAVDVSATALARGAAQAVAAGVGDRVDFQRHDLAETFPVGAFDLVSAQYLQSPVDFPRERVLRAAAGVVADGGLLLIVTHASVPPWSWADPETRFPTPEEALAALDLGAGGWRTERLGAPERLATGPSGEAATVRDTVIAVRRLAG